MEKTTSLYQSHIDAGGKMIDFGGYLLPVQYKTGVIAEHKAVRSAAGLFDISHMGELVVEGENALDFLQDLLTNDMAGMRDGDCRYSPMCYKNGGVVDDLIVYRKSEERYMMVVNASNKDKDLDWMRSRLVDGVSLLDESDTVAALALQGPKAADILKALVDNAAQLPQKNYTFVESIVVAAISCLVSRTGYTGEDGFELYCPSANAPALWNALLAAGKEHGLIPCGLAARDTLRLEAAMPLYGHEMNETITPLEAGLGMFVKMDKPDFVGKAALAAVGPPKRRRTGLRMTGRGIAREGAKVYQGDREIGLVTSGTQLPWLGYAGAMALLAADEREPGAVCEVDVRGRRVEAEVVRLPFYKRAK